MSAEPVNVADLFNHRYPVGTAVHAYPGTRDGRPLATRTRSKAWLLGDGTPVVAVEEYAGGIALTHIDVVVHLLTELPETPVCVTCRGDQTVPLVGATGQQFDPCPDCVVRGIPAVE